MKLRDSSDSSFVIEVNRENKVSSKKNFSFVKISRSIFRPRIIRGVSLCTEGVDNSVWRTWSIETSVTRSLSGTSSLTIAARISNNSVRAWIAVLFSGWGFWKIIAGWRCPTVRGFVRDFTGRIHSGEFFSVNGHSSHGYDLSRASILQLEWTFIFESVPVHKRFCRRGDAFMWNRFLFLLELVVLPRIGWRSITTQTRRIITFFVFIFCESFRRICNWKSIYGRIIFINSSLNRELNRPILISKYLKCSIFKYITVARII